MKRISILLIVLGIITITCGTIGYVMKSDEPSENNTLEPEDNPEDKDENNNENKDDEPEEPIDKEEESICLQDYLNGSLKDVTATVDSKKINLKVLSCMSEQKVENNKVKFYSKDDDRFFIEIYILNDNLTTYSDNLDKQYTAAQPTENYNVAITNDHAAESGKKYNIVNVYKKDDNGKINYKDYNMIRNLDDQKIIRLRFVTTKYDLEDGFTHMVESTLEIK